MTIRTIVTLLACATAALGVDGNELFAKRCGGCHALDRDREGPRLGGVYGRAAASLPTFEYSEALRKARVRWTEETLERWLENPDNVAPGTDMAFRVPKPDERRAIIEYLKQAK